MGDLWFVQKMEEETSSMQLSLLLWCVCRVVLRGGHFYRASWSSISIISCLNRASPSIYGMESSQWSFYGPSGTWYIRGMDLVLVLSRSLCLFMGHLAPLANRSLSWQMPYTYGRPMACQQSQAIH